MKCGDIVILSGLEADHLNGLSGEIVGEFLISRKRWPVKVHWAGEKLKRLKPENLWTEDYFASHAALLCHPRMLVSYKPEEVLFWLSRLVAGYQTLSRDLTRLLFADISILGYIASYYLEQPKPDPKIWGILLFFDSSPYQDDHRCPGVACIMKRATGRLQKEWKAFRQKLTWDSTSSQSEKDDVTRIWMMFGEKLGCKKTIDWAVFMWFLAVENPVFHTVIYHKMEEIPIFSSKLPSLKKCSHRLRCHWCGKVEEKGVHLRQCFRCGLVRYCSEFCNEQDWEDHFNNCLCRFCFHPDCRRSSTNQSCSGEESGFGRCNSPSSTTSEE